MNIEAEIDKLTIELEQETAIRDTLEASSHQIELNVIEVDKRLLEENKGTENEWKEKYEQQYATHQHLDKQLYSMKDKMQELIKLDLEDNDAKSSTKMNDADLRNMLRQLEREKKVLEGKLKDYEWRLDSESQELYKVNEDKNKYKLQVNQAIHELDEARLQSKTPMGLIPSIPGFKFHTKKTDFNLKQRHYGIPDNHRIIDPRKGPIKKTAAVKRLPKIKTSSSLDNMATLNANKKKKPPRKIKSSGITRSLNDMSLDNNTERLSKTT